MAEASSTSTLRTLMPSGGVWGVLSIMPRIWPAACSAAAGSSASLMPPALPRPPACTCALTTTLPLSRWAIARACAGVSATSPFGTATPNSRSSALAWYSWIFTPSRGLLLLGAELAQQPHDGIEELVGHPLLERDDRVVRDMDVLGADLGTTLRDVAEADAGRVLDEGRAVDRVERVHVEAGQLDEEARPRERALVLLVVADDVADVLAEEALDALVELLDAVDVLLHHPVGAIRLRRLDAQRRHLLGLDIVVGDVGDEVADGREAADGRHRDRLALIEEIHPRHAHEPRLAVDLGAARAALARLAVPAHREVGGLRGLDAVDEVEHHHPRIRLDAVLLEVPAAGVSAEHVHGEGRHHLRSWNSPLRSGGISGSGSRLTCTRPASSRSTTLTLPQVSSVYGWSLRVWPPRLSLRSSAASAEHSATVSSESRSSAVCQPGLYWRWPSTRTFAARALRTSRRLSASLRSASLRMMPTSACIVSCRSDWIA